MTSEEIRQKFLAFFEQRGHKITPSASLVPTDYGDNGTLFTTAGMQPMIPYLLGEPHPEGRRIADVQKCVRTGDIDDVGDNRHNTFFEMMGNWSLGDPDAQDGIGTGYFKKESIPWSFDFLTNKDYGLGLDPARFYVTVFAGTKEIPRDEESIKIWQEVFTKYGISNGVAGEDEMVKEGVRIIPLGVDDNFWIAGNTGPCGGDTEIFYDVYPNIENGLVYPNGEAGRAKPEGKFNDLVDSFRIIEVWNNVFMEFNKTLEGKYEPLGAKNVDTGMGLERITAVVNNKDNIFETDLLAPILNEIRQQVANYNEKSARIVADHIRTAVFMITENVIPSNTDRGYILRRIIRRLVRHIDIMQAGSDITRKLAEIVIEKYKKVYPELEKNREQIFAELDKEEEKFRRTLAQGLKEFEKGGDPFDLYQTFGFPIELTEELAKEKGIAIDREEFDKKMKEHQTVSKVGSEQKFKGGLASDSEQVVKYHTATHLLHSALRQVLGEEVQQKGSNITDERLRFDFAYPVKLTEEQKRGVEKVVNDNISANLPVCQIELSKEEAEKTGALHFFGEKYGDKVSIYYIGDGIEDAVSKEFCGGPHVEHTGNLGHFKITKEESVSAGVRRIKAILE
jgi:alanyl-tRNA synthetase